MVSAEFQRLVFFLWQPQNEGPTLGFHLYIEHSQGCEEYNMMGQFN